jgi:glutathione S-transferase
VTLGHPIFTRWPAQYPDRLQLFSLPTPNGVKVGIMLEETSLAYEPHRIDIMADESHDPAFLVLNPNGKIPAIYDPDGPSGTPLALFESGAILLYLADKRAVGSDPSCSSATEWACLDLSSGTDWVAGCSLTVGGQADTPSGPSDHGAALLFARPEARLCSI